MLDGIRTRWGAAYTALLSALVDNSRRYALWVFMLALLASLLGGWFIAGHFAIDTDMGALLSRDLPFQKRQHALDQAFPQLSDTIVIVINGQTPGLADQAAHRLTEWLNHHPRDFQYVYQPGGGPFFSNHALLYLNKNQLASLSDRLASAQPLIATLANDPTLPSLFNLLGQALNHKSQSGTLGALEPALNQIGATIQAFNRNQFQVLDWQKIMAPSDSGSPMNSRQRFVMVKPRFDYQQIQPAAAPIAHLRQGIANLHLDLRHGVQVHLTGSAMLDNEQLGAVAGGAGWATGLALGLVLLLLIIALRSLRMVIAAVVTLFIGLVWSTALGLLAVGQFNLLSIAFAVLFIGLSVDFGIQFCMRSREVAASGGSASSVPARTARAVGGALTLAGLACAISFFSVVPTHYAGLADLGIIAGISMIIAVFANLTVLPALLTLLRAHRPAHGAGFDAFAALPLQRWNKWIVGIATLAGIAALPLALSVRFDFNPLSLQNSHSEAMQTLKQLMQTSDFSPYSIDVLAPNLKAADTLVKQLQKLPTVAQAISLDSYVPVHQGRKLDTIGNLALVMSPSSLQMHNAPTPAAGKSRQAIQQLLAELKNNPSTPARQRLAKALQDFSQRFGDQPAAYEHLQQRLFATLPQQLDTLRQAMQGGRVTRETLPKSLKARYLAPDGRARVEVFSNLDLSQNQNLRRFVSDVRQVAPDAAGTPVLLVEGGNAVTQAFAQASVTALVLIALMLWLVLGRWRDVFLALSTLPLAGLFTAATMRLAGLSFNLANIIVIPLLIGLGVAYGIYFVVRWQEGVHLDRLLRSSTPAAVMFSALTTMTSFGSLALASSPGMAMLGQTLSLALAFVLIATLIVLPALLSLYPRHRARHGAQRKQSRMKDRHEAISTANRYHDSSR